MSPLLDIFITSVVPIISNTEMLQSMASKILKVSPTCSNSFTIFSSAIGSQIAAPI